MLFARLAAHLFDKGYCEISVLDNESSFISSFLERRSHERIPYIRSKQLCLSDDAVLLLPLSYLPLLQSRCDVNENTRLFLWDLHPFDLVEQTAFSGLYKAVQVAWARTVLGGMERSRRRKLAELIDIGINRRGIGFMCQKNYAYSQTLFGFQSQPVYVPIPIPQFAEYVQSPRHPRPQPAVHDIAWLSRLDSDKLQPIMQLLFDAAMWQRASGRSKLKAHIIGDGRVAGRLKSYAESIGIEAAFPGRVVGEALSKYLVNMDVAFAMGTSALECAIRGVPTILTRGSEFRASFRRGGLHYSWLFDSEGFNLSAEGGKDAKALQSFDNLLDCLLLSCGRAKLGEKSKVYALEHHDLSRVASKLLEVLRRCTFTYGAASGSGVFNYNGYEKCVFAMKRGYKAFGRVVRCVRGVDRRLGPAS